MSTDEYGRMRVPFRFVKEADVTAYGNRDGDGWWVYDEAKLFELPVRQLAELEEAMGGYAIPLVVRDFRQDAIMGRHAASWLAIYLGAGADVAGPYDKYEPAVMMIDWDFTAPAEDDDPAPLDSANSSSSPPEE